MKAPADSGSNPGGLIKFQGGFQTSEFLWNSVCSKMEELYFDMKQNIDDEDDEPDDDGDDDDNGFG